MRTLPSPGWNIRRRLWLALGLLAAAGCASLYPPQAPMEVSDSQLNWLTIRYRPLATNRPPCRIEIVGAGYLQFIQGESPLVVDDFAVDTEHYQWNNLTQEKLGMTPAEARRMLQQFVDAGLLGEPRQLRETAPGASGIASCRWRINNQPGGCVTSNPDLTRLVKIIAARLGRQER